MKTIILLLAPALALYGGACSGIDVGSSLYGHTSWHGFVAGSASSTYRQDVTNAPVDPHSTAWLTLMGNSAQNTFLTFSTTNSDTGTEGWSGLNTHYVHGNTQRRVAIRGNPTWSKTAVTGSMTAGSAVLTVGTWSTVQGRQTPYFSKSDVGLSVSVAGACTGTTSTCNNGTIGGNPGSVYIASILSPTQVTLGSGGNPVNATNNVNNVTVNVAWRESYPTDSDPGTFPLPSAPRIQTWYGPRSRPFGIFLDRYLDPYTGGDNEPSDQHMFLIDVDNCIEYDLWNVFDDGSSISAGTYAAFYLAGGDLQRPYNITGGGTVAGMPSVFGMLHYDELSAGSIPHALNIPALSCCTTAITGAASHTQCCGDWDPNRVPMGAKIRLKPGFNSSAYPASCAPLITQMKTYGLIVTDGGYTGQLGQETGSRWPDDCVRYMYFNFRVNATNFEVVQQANTDVVCMTGGKSCPNTLPTGNAPVINSFTPSSSTIKAGQSVLLRWSVSGVVDVAGDPVPLRNISYGLNPAIACSTANPCKLGPGWINSALHGEGVVMTPPAAGTYVYQLMVQNRFGRTKATTTVTVQ